VTLRSERLRQIHVVTGFDSGERVLDDWLIGSALNADRMGTARTFVWLDDELRVVAYMSLCPHEIRREVLPSKVGRGSPNVIPAILLARLALDRRLHGEGFGAQLLVDALGRAVDAVRLAGGRFIVVDALHERAAAFYVRFGFQKVPEMPLRLVMRASDAAAALGLPWP
jgi:GNAT superfamily N-acetyltransferase